MREMVDRDRERAQLLRDQFTPALRERAAAESVHYQLPACLWLSDAFEPVELISRLLQCDHRFLNVVVA
jgi:hypothetical protein